MEFDRLPLSGAHLIRPEPSTDDRGSFMRTFCAREFADHGLETRYVQANMSTNHRAGTVRGFHYQREPHTEVKLVRCIHGAIYDVIVDVRDGSPTYGNCFGVELSEANGLSLYVPTGFAHGYQALTHGAAVLYLVSAFYDPAHEEGVHHADPNLGIEWPLPVTVISSKDSKLPHLPQYERRAERRQ